MGTINYKTSDYITMGIKPVDAFDLLKDQDFRNWIMEEYHFRPEDDTEEVYSIASDVAHEYNTEDQAGAERMLEDLADLAYYHIAVQPGYYEGFSIKIENNYPVVYDSYEDRAEAQKEVTRIKKMLFDLADCGLCSVWSGWRTTYRDREETAEDIKKAVEVMRQEIRDTPTWRQYEKEGR